LDLKDVFSNKECRIKLPIDPITEEFDFWPLMQDTGLFIERTGFDDHEMFSTFSKFSLSLTELDWNKKEVQKVHTFSFEGQQHLFTFQGIVSDAMDPKCSFAKLAR